MGGIQGLESSCRGQSTGKLTIQEPERKGHGWWSSRGIER